MGWWLALLELAGAFGIAQRRPWCEPVPGSSVRAMQRLVAGAHRESLMLRISGFLHEVLEP